MENKDMGVAASPPGHSAEPEPVPVSAASAASTPNAGQWAVLSGLYGYEAVKIEAVTPKLIKHKRGFGRRLSQSPRDSIVALFDDAHRAKQLVQAIDGARDRFKKQRRDENARHDAVMAGINERRDAAVARVITKALAAQVGTHPKGGDRRAPALLSDAVAEGHAPNPSHPDDRGERG